MCDNQAVVHGALGLFGPHHHKHSCKGQSEQAFIIYTKPCRRPLGQSSNDCSTVAALRFRELHSQGDTVLHPSGSTQKKPKLGRNNTWETNLCNVFYRVICSHLKAKNYLDTVNVLQSLLKKPQPDILGQLVKPPEPGMSYISISHWPNESNRTSCPHPHFKHHRLLPRLMVTFYNLIAEDNTYVIKHGEGKRVLNWRLYLY